MTNIKFKSVPAQAWANNESDHYYNTELVPWFRVSGQPADYPSSFTPDIGSKHDFTVTHDASSFHYIYNKTDSFWPVEGDFDRGFSVQSSNTAGLRQFNYRIAGGKAHWMPAPIFRSLSFYWGNESNNAKSWYIKHTALVLKNWKTDEEKTYGFGMNTTNKGSRVVILNSNIDEVRAMGPDWFVYGVIFNLRAEATSSSLIGKSKLVDFRLGYECARPTGTNKLILPKQMTWGNLTSAMKAGQMKYEPIPPPPPPLGEWNWKGHSTSTALYQMCDNGNQRYAFFKSDWGNLYFDHVDKNGQTSMHTKFQQSIANGDEIWFKVNNQPAVQWTGSFNPVYTVYYCSFSLIYYDAPLPNEAGVIRWYDYDPDTFN